MNEIINVSQSTMLEALNRSEVDMQIDRLLGIIEKMNNAQTTDA